MSDSNIISIKNGNDGEVTVQNYEKDERASLHELNEGDVSGRSEIDETLGEGYSAEDYQSRLPDEKIGVKFLGGKYDFGSGKKSNVESSIKRGSFDAEYNIDTEQVEKEMEEFFELMDIDKNTPFTEEDIEDFEKSISNTNRLQYIPAKRFSNFGYHYVFQTYVPFTVDLSFMKLRSFEGIDFLHFISYINASNNLISDSELSYLEDVDDLTALVLAKNNLTVLNIPKLRSLRLLDVSNNNITWIHSMFELPELESLLLNGNSLKDISQLKKTALPLLRFLSAKNNMISDLIVDWPANLTHLYLAVNEITHLKGLAGLCKLRVLHLRKNLITTLSDFPKDMVNLEYLNIRANKIEDALEMRFLRSLLGLKTLIIAENPCVYQGEAEDSYRLIVLSCFPNLRRLDKKKVTRDEVEKSLPLRKIFSDQDIDADCEYNQWFDNKNEEQEEETELHGEM